MKRRLHILVLILLGFHISYAQQSGTNKKKSIQLGSTSVKTKKSYNQLKKPVETKSINQEPLLKSSSTEAGSTAGSLSVSLTGAASYSIPIMVAPGIKDVAPNIGINYSSQGANGLVGWGWNISGLSTISRIPATKYYDNKQDGIDFKDDRFSLDGQRLILKSGTYGSNGSVYQTENYSNIKVVAYGSSPYGSNYGPSHFIVFYPNGVRAWYGSFGNSRSKLEWAIYHWEDPQGNYVTYNYQSDNGLLSIDKIIYGGRAGGISAMNQINFTYVTRNRPENVFVGDALFKRTNLLKSIRITSNGLQYRKYELTHNTTSLGYQRLSSVTEYSSDNKSLRPITFNYDDTSSWINDRTISSMSYTTFDYRTKSLLAGDYDGDGRTDVITYNTSDKSNMFLHYKLFEPSSNYTYISAGSFSDIFSSTFLTIDNKISTKQGITTIKETSTTASSPTSSIRFRTFKLNNTVGVEYDKVWNTPKYRYDNSPGNPSYYNIPKKYLTGDFNGDGLTDVIAIEKTYTTTSCYPKNCDGGGGPGDEIQFKTAKKENKEKIDTKNAKAPGGDCYDCSSSTYNQYNSKVYFIDLDRRKTTNFSNLSGTIAANIGPKDIITSGDHNGDGKQDIYHFKEGKLYIYTLNESNYLVKLKEKADTRIKLDYPILLGDYNGDGKTDFIVPTGNKSSSWKYFLSMGKEFYLEYKTLPFGYYQDEYSSTTVVKSGVTIKTPLYEYRYTTQDVNGDGKTDIIMHNSVVSTQSKRWTHANSVEYISIYKSELHTSSNTPIFTYETGYQDLNNTANSYGAPIFLESNVTNGNLEYGYISKDKIFMYEFAKDHRKDALLKSITNNSVTTTIEYNQLNESSNAYTSDTSLSYPYININKANSFQLVKKLTEQGAGISRYQDFKYHGAVTNVGIGFQGFMKTKRSNWYGNGVGTLWTISKHDITKKGAVTEQWVSTSSHESNNYMSKTSYTYLTELSNPSKVFSNIPTKIIQDDKLTGIINTKNITYDAYKNPLTETTIFNGGYKQFLYTYSNNFSPNDHTYHLGRITKKVVTNSFAGNAFTTEEQYSYNNNLVTQLKTKGNGTSWNVEDFIYDVYGNVTRKTLTPSGMSARAENFKYDSSGRFLTESTDIEGLKTKFSYDTFGNPSSTTNPYNQITRFTYDGWNRLVSEKNYLGNVTTFLYTYLVGGGLTKVTNYPQGADEIVEYNALGWVTTTKKLGINYRWTLKSFQYDVAGRKIKESEPYFTTPSQWNTVAFDNYGREITRTSFNGLVANITYNGLVITVDDGSKTIKTTKDGGGNTVKIEDPGGVINYTYYGNGVMKTANYSSHVVSTEIDGWGRKTKLTDPSAGTYTYTYNSLGEVLQETTPKGTTAYTYDNFGKITNKSISGDETNMNLNYIYNSTTKLLTSIQGNNVRTNESYNYTYTYDSHKRPLITKEQNGKAYFEHQVSRDGYGRVNSETYISRKNGSSINSTVKVRNIFDANSGILTEIQDYNSNASLWKMKEVNERGQAKEIHLGNGMIKKRTYDQFGFLTKILDQTSGSSPKTALNLDYSFNTVRGNLNSRSNHNLGWNESFSYDNLDRLTNISGSVVRTQQYDGRGRITSNSNVGTYNYGSATSYRLQDVNLNTQGDLHYQNHPIQKVKYNAYKKPVSISVKDKAKVDFEYGVLQNRSHSYYGGNQENKLDRRYQKHYSGISSVEIEEDKQGNTKIITYIGGDAYSAPIAHIKQTASGSANGYHYLHRDYLGSILAITTSNTTIQEQRQFGAWGEVDKFKTSNSELDFEYDTTLLNRGYTGHEHFIDIALIHMNGRMYDAKLGRFLSPDNYIQEPFSTQSFNRFGYVWNNPLKYTDPSGEFFIAALVGALISVATNGIINTINGKPFFRGAGLAALTGAIGGVFAKAIGNAVQGLKGILKVGVQAVAHGHLGGMMSAAMGGDYWSGFAAGAIGSSIAAGAGSALKSASNFWKGAGMITAGSLSGGVGSVIAGGKFWDGFRNGAISSSLNHVAHILQQKKHKYFKSKKKAYDYAVSQSENEKGKFIKEVSGFELENGDYIVMDSSENTKTHSYYEMTKKGGQYYVTYNGKMYQIKSQFHTHGGGYGGDNWDPIGVSGKDLSLMSNGTFKNMYILSRGIEWQMVFPGNQYLKISDYGIFEYSLINKGKW